MESTDARDGQKEGEKPMPAEKFYCSDQVEGDGKDPDLTVTWGEGPTPGVFINGIPMDDRAGLNRLINSLRRARNRVFGKDA